MWYQEVDCSVHASVTCDDFYSEVSFRSCGVTVCLEPVSRFYSEGECLVFHLRVSPAIPGSCSSCSQLCLISDLFYLQ